MSYLPPPPYQGPGQQPVQPVQPVHPVQQPFPQQPVQPEQPEQRPVAHLELTVQGSRWSSSLVPPNVFVNGQPLTAEYGTRMVPVWAGPVRVDVVAQWTKQYGEASLEVVAQPDDVIPVFYAAPLSVFQRGSIGHVKQRRRGWVPFWIVIAVMVLAVAIPVTIGVLQGNVTP